MLSRISNIVSLFVSALGIAAHYLVLPGPSYTNDNHNFIYIDNQLSDT